MSYKKVISTSLPFFIIPESLEDIISITDIEDEISVDAANEVISSIKTINDIVEVDQENDMATFIDNGYARQTLEYSVKSLIKVLYMKPEYIKEVSRIFYLESYFGNMTESIENEISNVLAQSKLAA